MAARLLLSPALITFGAAVVAVYPFERRLILFLVPALATMLALGLRHLASSRRRGVAWAGRAGVGALAIPLGVTLLWIPHGGLPLASDSRGLFAALEAELEDGDAVVVDYDTEPALRYYGTALSVEPVVARNPRGVLERAAGISEALRRAGPGPTWVAIARVQETSAPPIRSAIPSDLAAGRWWFPTVWEWFAEGLRGWDLLETVEENLDENWRITARIQLHGAALLRLEPVD